MDLNQQLNRIVEAIVGKMEHGRKMYAAIGQILVGEFKKNIETGRPPQWPMSKAAIRRHGQPLRRTGFLMRSNVFNATDTGVIAGPTAFYAGFLYRGVTRPERSELIVRNRISRGRHKGRFKRGTTRGQGFTFRQYSFGPWNLFYLPPDAIGRIKEEAVRGVTQ